METATPLLLGEEEHPGFLQSCIKSKVSTVDDDVIKSVMMNYCRLAAWNP
jgi:hypothetical protein